MQKRKSIVSVPVDRYKPIVGFMGYAVTQFWVHLTTRASISR